MYAPALLGLLFKGRILGMAAKGLGSCLLGGSMLWWVAAHAGPPRNEVIVHVTEPDVEVAVGDHVFRLQEWTEGPIACELPPGPHTLRMRRGHRVLYEE